jgi:hypothetical protein
MNQIIITFDTLVRTLLTRKLAPVERKAEVGTASKLDSEANNILPQGRADKSDNVPLKPKNKSAQATASRSTKKLR